jgi:hypothetical protein
MDITTTPQEDRPMSAIYSVHIKGTPTVKKNDIKYTKQNVLAFEGKVRVVAHADDFFGGEESRAFRSRVLENPTWGTLFRVFKSQMKRTRDYHHAFLEGARVVGTDGEVKIVELLLGS